MKFIAIFTSFVVAVMAEPEPFLGRFGYAGIGRPAYGYANAYGLGPLARRTYITSAPVVTKAHVTAVVPAATAVNHAVAPVAPAFTSAVAPYASTATLNAVPAAPSTLQFHAQDEFGNYVYGYDNANSAKKEVGNAGVGVTGSYTVKDLQGSRTVHYVADAHGFRITPAHGRKKRSLFYPHGGLLRTYPGVYNNAVASPLPYSIATPSVATVPAVTANAIPLSTPVVQTVAAAPSTYQFHAQDEFGNYGYGYQNINSAKPERGNAHTAITGGYRYVPSDATATHPATMMSIQYNPGFSTGYRIYH